MSDRIVALGATEYFMFSTRRFSSGASYTLAGTPAIHTYEDNGTTQITAGNTLTADFDSVTGLNLIEVAATSGNGYEAGKRYNLVIGAGTVDSVSVVGTVVGTFRIETNAELTNRLYAESVFPNSPTIATTTGNTTGRINLTDVLDAQTADASLVGASLAVWDATNGQVEHVTVVSVESTRLFNVVCTSDGAVMDFTVAAGDRVFFTGFSSLRATTPGRTLDIAADGGFEGDTSTDIQTAAAAAITAYDPPTNTEMEARTLVAANYATATALSSHDAKLVGTIAAGTHNPQSGDAYARLGAPAGASISADVAAVKTDTGNLVTRITSTLFTGITSLAEWLGLIAGKQTGNTTARTELRATGAGSGTFDETTDSQEAIRDRGDAAWAGTGATAGEIADAVWDEAAADHVGAGSVGERVERLDLLASGGSGQLTGTRAANLDELGAANIPADVDTLLTRATEARLAELDAGNLPADVAAVAALVAASAIRSALGLSAANLDTQLGDLPTNAELTAAIASGLLTFHGAYDLTLSGVPTATSFTVDVDVSTDVRTGFVRLTSGALSGEARPAIHTGTTVTVTGAHADMPAGWRQFSAAPASGVTARFFPVV